MARERMSLKRFIDRYITAGSEQKLSCEVQVDGAQAKLGEPVPVIVTGTVNSGGTLTGVSATGTVPVTEASAAGISTSNQYILNRMLNGEVLNTLADGTATVSAYSWVPITPVTVTADGAGLPPATQLVALSAGKRIDASIHLKVRTVAGAGQYIHNFREACLTAPAPVTPAWADVVIPHAALETFPGTDWGVRIETVTAGLNLGIADGANGDWPNNAAITYTGFYRYI